MSHARPSKLRVGRYGWPSSYECRDHFGELRRLIEGSSAHGEGLLLEVEVEESLQELLSAPGKRGGLLDVTIVQQSEATVSLDVEEVSDFIEMVNHYGGGSKRDLPERGSQCGKLTAKKSSCSRRPEAQAGVRPQYVEVPQVVPPTSKVGDGMDGDSGGYQSTPDELQVYTTPYTFSDMRHKMPCVNPMRSSDEKPGTPCLCQHCGMVGVLVESQKRPAIPHAPNPKVGQPSKHPKRRDINKSKSETNLLLLRELSKKISSLEERLDEHEEKTVRKDYFKLVIHKLLTQYSHKINELKQAQARSGVSTSTQYNTKHKEEPRKGNPTWERYQEPERDRNRGQQYPKASTSRTSNASDAEKAANRTLRQSRSRHVQREFTEAKRAPNTSQTRPKSGKRHDADVLRLPQNLDDVPKGKSRNVYTVRDASASPYRNPDPYHYRTTDGLEVDIPDSVSTDTVKKLCDLVHSRCSSGRLRGASPQSRRPCDDSAFRRNIQARKDGHKKPEIVHHRADIPDRLLQGSRTASAQRRGDRVDVSYVNPAVTGWLEQQSSEDLPTIKRQVLPKTPNKHTIEEKIRYLKALARKKNVDETELWNNILSQAKKHVKSNEDTVSIQLPGGVRNEEMSELELTLSNLKEIVKKTRGLKKINSQQEPNYRSSTDNLRKLRDVGKRVRR